MKSFCQDYKKMLHSFTTTTTSTTTTTTTTTTTVLAEEDLDDYNDDMDDMTDEVVEPRFNKLDLSGNPFVLLKPRHIVSMLVKGAWYTTKMICVQLEQLIFKGTVRCKKSKKTLSEMVYKGLYGYVKKGDIIKEQFFDGRRKKNKYSKL